MKLKNFNEVNLEVNEILDNYIYCTSKDFNLQIEDINHQFGILFEIVDMHEATGEEEYQNAPFLVSANIVPNNPNKKFSEGNYDDSFQPSNFDYILDAYQYCGGIPIDHILDHEIVNSTEKNQNNAFQNIKDNFTLDNAIIKEFNHQFGSVAAQLGKGTKMQHIAFKSYDAALEYIHYMIKYRVSVFSMLIGFTLDRPYNLMSQSGWSMFEDMI